MFPYLRWVDVLSGFIPCLKATSREIDTLFDQIIDEHRSALKSHEEVTNKKDFVSIILRLQKEGMLEMNLTEDNIKAILLDMFAAGTDTTFITLDWGMTELLMNPRVMEKAQAEVRKVVGERRVVLESDLKQLDYMRVIIKEIFRLHPPAPVLLPRESMEDITVNGFDIPAKTRVFVNAWAIGRDPESWENPESFEPERFLDNPVDFKGQDFELIPFGAGRRICPGISFSTASTELALAQLLHSFDWELPPGTEGKDLDLTEAFGITMHRIANLMVITKPHFP
ncbi:hypothetical protein PTKIN_Ptkin04bG0038600 [Pterospermum kingtungense]